MYFINKRNKRNRKQAHSIVNKFLHRGWNKEFGRYVNCDYSDLQHEGKMKLLLLREQKGLCCYCMRQISFKKHTTLEHVLPRKTDGKDCNAILYYLNSARFMKRYVMWTPEPPQRRVFRPPYPHYCAYENLVASCDGSIYDVDNPEIRYVGKLHNSCNNHRGNAKILPLFFNSHINELIIYEKDGELTFDEDLYGETIRAINLEYPTLKLMRRAWAEVCVHYTPEDVKIAMVDKEFRRDIINDTNLNVFDRHTMTFDNMWSLFYEYRWFYGYFSSQNH